MKNRLILFLFDFAKLAASAMLGLFVYALTFQLLVRAGLISAEGDGDGYGRALTYQVIIVWLGGICVGLGGLFIRTEWRWPLTLAPLYAPALYAFIIALAA